MRSSSWHAHGNEYLLVEPAARLTADEVRELVGSADGVLEVVARADNSAEVVIWNPDGSTAEMSGNGTRIAARWLAGETGHREVRIQVGERTVPARLLDDGLVEQEIGEFHVFPLEPIAGLAVIPVSVGNPHAVVVGDPDELPRVGPLLETHPRFRERTNVQVVRVDRPGEVTARVWERGVGETASSGTSAVAVAAATHPDGSSVRVRFPGGELLVRLESGRAFLTGPAERVTVSPDNRPKGARDVERSPDVEAFVGRVYELLKSGPQGNIEDVLAQDDSVLAIGTDPDEWWSGRETIARAFREQMEATGGFPIESREIEGYAAGDVGWFASRFSFTFPDAPEALARLTGVAVREGGEWRLAQIHVSIGVPNEEALGQELPV